MKLFFGIFSLIIAIIGAQGANQIEIFEIHQSDNGEFQIKNVNTNNQIANPLLKLLGVPKPENKAVRIAKQLVSHLKTSRNEKNTNGYNDDARIYIVNGEDFDESTAEDSPFVDKTRNDRATNNVEEKSFRDLLLQMLQPERKKPLQKKRKLGLSLNQARRMTKPVLTTDDGTDSSTS